MGVRLFIGRVAMIAVLAWLLGPSCAAPEPASSGRRPIAASAADALRARAGEWIGRAWLSKPSRSLEGTDLFVMAPLLVHALPAVEGEAPAIGAVLRDPLSVDPTRPTVYYRRSSTSIRGHDHGQWSFVWWYASDDARPMRQGVRVTLDREGRPMVWEVLDDSTGADLVFVSEELETTAFESFGGVARGRDFAVERSAVEAPAVVVVRVIESGPIAMGPFVYLDGTSHDVRAVICRCMPSQVDEIAGTGEYDLVPLDSLEPTLAPPWPPRTPASFLRIP